MFWTYFCYFLAFGFGIATLKTLAEAVESWWASLLLAFGGCLWAAMLLAWLDQMNILARLGA